MNGERERQPRGVLGWAAPVVNDGCTATRDSSNTHAVHELLSISPPLIHFHARPVAPSVTLFIVNKIALKSAGRKNAPCHPRSSCSAQSVTKVRLLRAPTEVLSGVALTTEGAPHGAYLNA